MSFANLDRGLQSSTAPGEFASLSNRIAQAIHQLRSNTAAMHRYTVNDVLENNFPVLLEQSRSLSKKISADLLRLKEFRNTDEYNEEAISFTRSKLSRDFNVVLADLQRTQQRYADQEAANLTQAQQELDRNAALLEEEQNPAALSSGRKTSQTVQQPRLTNDQIQFQQRLINERQDEIEDLAQGITELNEIFRDLSTIVTEQGDLITNIEYNIGNVSSNAKNASTQLQLANNRARKARKRSFCFFLILAVIVAVILAALIMG
ncbi:SNARE Pep12 [Schizosaccharomyces japonicus yFS275]|uniref:SNARE Pep12 n=1 Tax=Schizosaccharomyces japonicus (strain yFS275 / FY16936) TaxID=402676 RepID=B6K579_SCHJY|nr:SNARE Pep12 [Schizosaccharomyces japonicus yFS275]EEB08683.1 SNARE Pep12 [Schizosaccharomyces japonicus yFS275]